MLGFSLIVLTTCILTALFFLLFTKDIAKKIQISGLIVNLLLMLILTFGFFMGRPEFIDIILVFLLLNLVGLIGFLRILRHGKIDVSSKDLMDKSIVND
ncbi:monovalent cation/H+ antiporter complex subunit F [Betaproteobacteria bacterium]|nr:monovalent cation/H+ antiporter complex subunit F [Betaproteobacteria bacterium]